MNFRNLMLIIVVLTKAAFALGSAESAHSPGIVVMSVDGGDEVRGMDPQTFATFNREKKGKILPPSERDRKFQNAGITTGELEGMDQLDRDLLYLNSMSRSIDELCARYPRISRTKLLKLMLMTRDEK